MSNENVITILNEEFENDKTGEKVHVNWYEIEGIIVYFDCKAIERTGDYRM